MITFFRYVFRALHILFELLLLSINIYIINNLKTSARRKPIGYFLRRTCTRLGATFIKLGQFLAIRIDLFSKNTIGELEKLFVSIAPLSFSVIKKSIESSFSTTIELLYSSFDPIPLASASISQVHRAVTHKNEQVVVKVIRPDFRYKLKMDTCILLFMATIADWLRLLGFISLKEAVREFADFTEKELDFYSEAASADRLRKQPDGRLKIPIMHWSLTRPAVLTMEYIEGKNLVDISRSRLDMIPGAAGERPQTIDLNKALEEFSMESLHQMLAIGFFHGDPHPGNVIVQPDSKVALVDFGICGYLTYQERNYIAGYMRNVALGNIRLSFQNLSHLFYATKKSNKQAFRQEMCELLDKWHRGSGGSGSNARQYLGQYADATLLIAKKHAYRMNMNLLLFWRTMISLDSTVLRFAPDHSILDTLNRFFSSSFGRSSALSIRPEIIPGLRAVISGEATWWEFLCRTLIKDLQTPLERIFVRETNRTIIRFWKIIFVVVVASSFLGLFLITIIR